MKAKKAIKKAFEYVKNGEGFSFVEILSICPTNWRKNIYDSLKWVEENMVKEFELKVFKD